MKSPIDLVHHAIASGIFGQIQWDDRADERTRSNLDLQGLTPEGIRRLLHAFVCGGGRLDERQETRSDWLQANVDRPPAYRDCWYRAVVPVPGLFPKGLFIEVRLFDSPGKSAESLMTPFLNGRPSAPERSESNRLRKASRSGHWAACLTKALSFFRARTL